MAMTLEVLVIRAGNSNNCITAGTKKRKKDNCIKAGMSDYI
jgi:hypothetical protein